MRRTKQRPGMTIWIPRSRSTGSSPLEAVIGRDLSIGTPSPCAAPDDREAIIMRIELGFISNRVRSPGDSVLGATQRLGTALVASEARL